MATYMLVRHKVKDFSEWKPGYDEHLPKRDAAGLTEKYLLHSDQDPNEVVVLFEASNLDKAKAFAASEELQQAMQRVGVIDKPDIYFLKE
ncbi:MAG: cyclase [Phycisphaerae bacterium]|nr:cyclase [Phycisphaerae bacterium]NIP52816.1 cyclase [Phycisphaerae bacterium]NIX28856.1 cyclase [Phycisphaerae bacterium]